MRSKVINWLGSVLLVAGLAVLVGVGITYAHNLSAAPAPHWNGAQIAHGKALARTIQYQNSRLLPVDRTQKAHLLRVNRNQLRSPATHAGRTRSRLPQPGSEPAIRMVIPKIMVDAPVVDTQPVNGVWQVADWAVGHLAGSPNPGGVGNMAVAAHDDIKGEIFKRVGELSPGDKVLLYTQHAVYTYVVVGQQAVDPTDSAVLDPTPNATLTMVTCTPYWVDGQRLIVTADLKGERAR